MTRMSLKYRLTTSKMVQKLVGVCREKKASIMSKSIVRISTLKWADQLVGYALFVMQTYLTDVWEISFTRAAAILNIQKGISIILQMVFQCFVDVWLGNVGMLAVSSIAYSVGIGFVTMSTPHVLANSALTCKLYKLDCIGSTQKALFYAGLALIAMGMAGYDVSLCPLLDEQPVSSTKAGPLMRCLKLLSYAMVVITPIVGAIGLGDIEPWTLQFGIPAIFTVVSTCIFMTGLCCFKYRTIEQERNTWTVSSVLEHVKIALQKVPMLPTFIICGTVLSSGNTYFVEQAERLDTRIGKWKNVPLQILLLFAWLVIELFGNVVAVLVKKYKRYGPPVGIGVSMVFSILCCITAAKTEQRRLHIIRKYDIPTDGNIPMSIYWLLFQFFFLAGFKAILENSLEAFYNGKACETVETCYLECLSEGALGLGYICTVLVVTVVGKISEIGGHSNWFQFSLSESRLDKYYWVLATLSSLNLIVYVAVALLYRDRILVVVVQVAEVEANSVATGGDAEGDQHKNVGDCEHMND